MIPGARSLCFYPKHTEAGPPSHPYMMVSPYGAMPMGTPGVSYTHCNMRTRTPNTGPVLDTQLILCLFSSWTSTDDCAGGSTGGWPEPQ